MWLPLPLRTRDRPTVPEPRLFGAQYWLLGLPFGAMAAFKPFWGEPLLGLLGLWLGMTLAVYIHCLSYLSLSFGGRRCCYAIRWEEAASEAQQRLAEENSHSTRRGEEASAAGVAPLPALSHAEPNRTP